VEQVEMVKHLLFQAQVLQELVVVEVVGNQDRQVLRGQQKVVQVAVVKVIDTQLMLLQMYLAQEQNQVAQTLEEEVDQLHKTQVVR
jgi:hypothetical protein|tara:strand:+ start:204 stop:461 length:258 start_codon:yes stop_codon:yes gene_type:complete